MGEYETLRWEREGNVATVTLDRPEKLNAMSARMFDEIETVFRRAAQEDDVRCLVVTGAGGAFCSGADLTDPANQVTAPIEARARMQRVNATASAVINCPVPTIAKVTGIAAGAGCNLALACDLVVATHEAKFAELFVKRGLVVDFGGTWVLSRALPLNKAKELAMLGDTITAGEADRLGLLNRLCDETEVDAVVKDLSERLASLPPVTVRTIKSNLNRASEQTIEETLETEALTQSISIGSEDTREAILAWVEKREPRFTGS